MPYIDMPFTVHLDNTLCVTPLSTLFANGDNAAHKFALTILCGDVHDDLNGCTVKCKFYRMAESTVVKMDGTVEGGKAVVVLDKACYDYTGRFTLTISIKQGEANTTVFYGDGYMHGQSADTVITGEYIVYDIDTLIEKLAEIDAATEAANTATSRANTATGKANTAATNANNAASAANTAASGASGWANATMTATALASGSAPTATVTTASDGHKVITVGIPRGNTGATPQISVQVATGAAGSEASVSVSGTAENPVIHLTIPRGYTGAIENLTINGKPVESGTITLKASDVGALPSGGTAVNASKLGGKAPEYYIQPRNLLDNSDFRNPVNQRGKTSYSNPGYSIDRWRITNNHSSVTVDDDGVTFSANGGTCYPQQVIVANTNMVGKTFTAAICLKDGSVTVTSGVLTALSPASNTLIGNRAAITNGNGAELAMYARTDGNLMIQPHIPDGVSLGLRWAALYEGSYTADTLPPYVPKGKHVEMLNCGVSLTPHNLLDNGDFLHPVNQRGKTSVSNNGYFIDRWIVYSADEAKRVTSIDSNGLTTAGGSTVRQIVPAELVPKDTGEYTFAVCKSDGIIDFPGIWKDSNGNLICPISSAGTYIWAALYEGSYTVETLPPYVPKGYAAELEECRRYFRRYTAKDASLILSGLVTSSTKTISVNAPELTPMRTKNVSIAYSGSGVIIRGVSGYATECSNGSIYGNISVSPYQNNSSFCATIDINKKDGTAWGLTNNTPVVVNFAANSTLDYIADL